MDKLELHVTHQHFDLIIAALMKQPYELVAQIIAELIQEVQEQRPRIVAGEPPAAAG
jgi:hypothetical protein